MPATEKTVTTYVDVTDNYDDKKLPDGTDPFSYTHEGKRYTAFLSDANKKKLTDALALVAEFVEKSDAVKEPAKKTAAKKTANKPADGDKGPSIYSGLEKEDKATYKGWLESVHNLTGPRALSNNDRAQEWLDAGKPAA